MRYSTSQYFIQFLHAYALFVDPGAYDDRLNSPYHGPDIVHARAYNEQPGSPYSGPDDLTEFLGPEVMAFHRYPSVSESGYSDGKQLKKVVYEVIV